MATVGLVGCAKKKRDCASEARDLYISSLFRKSREYIERRCDTWFILSAKYGLVSPNKVIEPYDETLKEMSTAQREQWAERVWGSLHSRLHTGDLVVILAGEKYYEYLIPRIEQAKCSVEVPLEGLKLGPRLRWLNMALSRPD
jgi:cytoplasmic iron level regulating protein YaaA (DUF328/UPF0246 family)